MTGAETWAADLAGGALIVLTSRSVARTLLMPGSRVGLLLKWTDEATDRVFRLTARFVDGHERRARFRAVHAPLILAIQLWTWLALYGLAFALLLWPVLHHFSAALRESGSSLLTMGFAAPGWVFSDASNPVPTWFFVDAAHNTSPGASPDNTCVRRSTPKMTSDSR